jgi:hypothetical protein
MSIDDPLDCSSAGLPVNISAVFAAVSYFNNRASYPTTQLLLLLLLWWSTGPVALMIWLE